MKYLVVEISVGNKIINFQNFRLWRHTLHCQTLQKSSWTFFLTPWRWANFPYFTNFGNYREKCKKYTPAFDSWEFQGKQIIERMKVQSSWKHSQESKIIIFVAVRNFWGYRETEIFRHPKFAMKWFYTCCLIWARVWYPICWIPVEGSHRSEVYSEKRILNL